MTVHPRTSRRTTATEGDRSMSSRARVSDQQAAFPGQPMALAALRVLACAALCAAASAAQAQADFAQQKTRLVAAIEAAGCIVNDKNEAAILRASGLTAAQGSVVVSALMQTGEAVPFGDDLRLNTGACKR